MCVHFLHGDVDYGPTDRSEAASAAATAAAAVVRPTAAVRWPAIVPAAVVRRTAAGESQSRNGPRAPLCDPEGDDDREQIGTVLR